MIDLSRYFITGKPSEADLLSAWNWLFKDQTYSVHQITSMGDMFLIAPDGTLHFLDTIEGQLVPFAANLDAYTDLLQDRHVRQRYLATALVRDLVASGVVLQAGQCYSPDHPPILGGTLDQSNMRPVDVVVHMSIMGQIHKQLRDLPPGTPITDIVCE